ncbi:hypothetical protein KIK06_24825 [Nocardiopsis sp. EMB25]|uniref:hypothetical protein n=1 Tax=Nocardiopsis sp. EMB25 TaxID=2835867 RepID=UPI002285057E|nr:hypothetical protein [Nocardiopsis sp. EMB25]MCY9787113.1 hypothetical protein [Nocardiopsis sp. EMB25]
MLTRTNPGYVALLCAGTVAMVIALPQQAAADGFFVDSECANGQCGVTARSSSTRSGTSEENTVPSVPSESPVDDGVTCLAWDLEFAQSGKEGPQEMPPGMARCEGAVAPAAAAEFDPVALAEQARALMRLPEPDIGTAPTPDKLRFVNIPAWMWVDERDWEPVSATASVSAGSVTVVASPERVVWDTGDGHEVVCTGPGTVFTPTTRHADGSPDCGHTYTTLPPGGAGATVDLTAVWEWAVSWSTTDGRGGDLEPLTTTSTATVPVSEIHSVVTDIR